MCWSETPHGVFDSTRASKIADALMATIYPGTRKRELEIAITGHMEALRPLLNEWSECEH